MAYDFEMALKDIAVETLKRAHAAFVSGDLESYAERLRQSAAAIEGIGRLGISADNPRFLWIDRLICDWRLVDTLSSLRDPEKLIELYRQCVYPPCPASLVIERDTPYLPAHCTDVYAFYDPAPEKAEELGRHLEQAVALYSSMTYGGGAGVDLLYRAGLALRRGELRQALWLTHAAKAIAGPWLEPCIDRLMRQMEEEETA